MSGVRVLVVDDERKIRELVGSYLERQGYAVTLAATGRAALDAAPREHPDLIVLDLRLPDIQGEEVARSIREVSPVPIIMLTAKSAENDRVAGLRIGAEDYLVKPFSVRELAARVEAVLRRTGGQRRRLSFDAGRLVVDRAAHAVLVEGQPAVSSALSSPSGRSDWRPPTIPSSWKGTRSASGRCWATCWRMPSASRQRVGSWTSPSRPPGRGPSSRCRTRGRASRRTSCRACSTGSFEAGTRRAPARASASPSSVS